MSCRGEDSQRLCAPGLLCQNMPLVKADQTGAQDQPPPQGNSPPPHPPTHTPVSLPERLTLCAVVVQHHITPCHKSESHRAAGEQLRGMTRCRCLCCATALPSALSLRDSGNKHISAGGLRWIIGCCPHRLPVQLRHPLICLQDDRHPANKTRWSATTKLLVKPLHCPSTHLPRASLAL
jgi:hypothetical protein